MIERLLTTGDVCEATGISPKQLASWCDRGVVVALTGGGGQGRHRQFTPMQTIGIAVALAVHRTEQSCVLDYCRQVVAAFSGLTEEKLLAMIEDRGRGFVGVHGGRVVLQGRDYPDWPDVQRIHRDVTKRIEKIERRLRHQRGGRVRGLAGSAAE